jgi:hypothetical protein
MAEESRSEVPCTVWLKSGGKYLGFLALEDRRDH